ncbi:MAG TPA: hypothetical protein VG815_21715 [Chloroflexota bacterium]|jgi:hypothetical protein|nr:hypothetical protein [Chloroflexota bacterium]
MKLRDTVEAGPLAQARSRHVTIGLCALGLMTAVIVAGCGAKSGSPPAPKFHAMVAAKELAQPQKMKPRLVAVSIGKIDFVKSALRMKASGLNDHIVWIRAATTISSVNRDKGVIWVANLGAFVRRPSVLTVTRIAGLGPHPHMVFVRQIPPNAHAIVEGTISIPAIKRAGIGLGTYELKYSFRGRALAAGRFVLTRPGSSTSIY